MRQLDIKTMREFADVFPGATIHDYENAKRIRFLLLELAWQKLHKLIFPR